VLRVAVDGPDAAGKTTLADELAETLHGRGREVIRIGIDGFHRPRSMRRRRGSLSAEGYYHDSFDYEAIRQLVLEPLGPGGDRRYRKAVFDYRTDQAVDEPPLLAPEGAVMLFDGVFMLRPELRDSWDVSIFLDIEAEEVLRRALARDSALLGGSDVVCERYRKRYLPGQQLYRTLVRPERVADVVIDNNDPAEPRVLKWFSDGEERR
jgi:uridine kinase